MNRNGPVLTALAVKRFIKVDWEKYFTKNDFFRYAFTGGEVFRLNEDSVQVEKRPRGNGGSSTSLTQAAVPVFF